MRPDLILAITSEDVLLAYGPLGVMAVLFLLLGRRILKENDDLRAENKELNKVVLSEVVPTVKQSVDIHHKRQAADELTRDVLRDIQANQHAMKTELSEIRRSQERR